MTDHNQKKLTDTKKGVNLTAVAVTGAVIGAGVAIAGVVALKDKKNREKVKETLNVIKDKSKNYLENVQKKVQDEKHEGEKNITEMKVKENKVLISVKDMTKKTRTK